MTERYVKVLRDEDGSVLPQYFDEEKGAYIEIEKDDEEEGR